jgi:hypothetical protein
MPFEPSLPGPYQFLFHGHIQTAVTDPHGTPVPTIISLTDDWHLTVNWEVHGLFVPSVGGKWIVRAYLESIGPGPEPMVAQAEIPMTGGTNYTKTFFIGPNVPSEAGPYKLVTVITSLNLLGTPAPFAAYDEGPILQFYQGQALPPVPPTP